MSLSIHNEVDEHLRLKGQPDEEAIMVIIKALNRK